MNSDKNKIKYNLDNLNNGRLLTVLVMDRNVQEQRPTVIRI